MTQLYRHFDKNDVLLYIGISLSTIQRLEQHKRKAHWFDQITRVSVEKFKTRKEALLAETLAIKTELPKYNIIHSLVNKSVKKVNLEATGKYKAYLQDPCTKELLQLFYQYKWGLTPTISETKVNEVLTKWGNKPIIENPLNRFVDMQNTHLDKTIMSIYPMKSNYKFPLPVND